MNVRIVDELSPFIDGAFSSSESESAIEVINPSNGRKLFSLGVGRRADADRAVASARRAFEDGRWSTAPPSFRKKTLHRFAELIEREAVALDRLDAIEMVKPVSVGF